jgi:uncharacterized protein
VATTKADPAIFGPIRTCVGCRERRPQHDLVRLVVTATGGVEISRTAPGRGAWICRVGCIGDVPSAHCMTAARRRRAFDRAWRCGAAPGALDALMSVVSPDGGARDCTTTGKG